MGLESKNNSVFDEIYDTYAGTVYKTAMKYSENHHVAEEIVQDVFLKLLRHEKDVNKEAAGKWLTLTTKHMALNYNRDHAREYLVEDLLYDEEALDQEVEESPENRLLTRIEHEEEARLLDDIFGALYRENPRWYEAVTITYVLEKPQKEVAEEMGITLEVLHSTLYRAKRWIRRNYGDRYRHLDSIRK